MGLLGIILLLVAGGIIFKIRTTPQEARKLPAAPLLEQPIVKITDPQRGNENALLTIVYFTDFGCDACANTWPTIQALENDEQFKGKVRFVWKDFPAHENIFPETKQLHQAARCAATMGKFWEFQAAAFARVGEIRLNIPVLQKVIQEAGVNPAAIQACMNSSGIQSQIADTRHEGERLNITVTPTMFILETKKRFDGIPPYHVLAGNIRNAIAQRMQDN